MTLQKTIDQALNHQQILPFSIYSSVREQRLFNVPIVKPLLIFVLGGEKHLGKSPTQVFQSGEFIFLSNKTQIDMRNIPSDHPYYALLIEFDDFIGLDTNIASNEGFCSGRITPELNSLLQQFIEWSCIAPEELWSSRRKELLLFLYHLGYKNIPAMVKHHEISHRIHDIITANLTEDISLETLCSQLAISESTLRRRLKSEGTGLQDIKDQAKLGHGLQLL